MDNYNNKFRYNNEFQEKPLELSRCTLYQVGDLYCVDDTFIDSHKQGYFELSFIDSGTGNFYTNDIPSIVGQGDIYFSFPGDIHKIKPEKSDPLRFFYIALTLHENSSLQPILDELHQRFASPNHRIHNAPQIFPYIRTILAEISTAQTYCLELMDANIIQMLVYLYRSCNNDISHSIFYKIDTKKEMISNLVHYIDDNILNITGIGDISAQFFFDRSYFSKIFKSIMGVSLQYYLQKKKLEKAKLLLINEKKTITETAELLHYSSIHNFSRAFKSFYQLSPQQYIYAVSRENTIV